MIYARKRLTSTKKFTQGEKKALEKRKKPLFVKLCMGVLAGYIAFCFGMESLQAWKLRQQLENIEDEKKIYLQIQADLENQIKDLQHPDTIERMARENLGMVKKGESIIIPAIQEENIPTPKGVKSQDDFND